MSLPSKDLQGKEVPDNETPLMYCSPNSIWSGGGVVVDKVMRVGSGRQCERKEVQVRPGQEEWLVSPGHAWPGVADGSQKTCLWKVKGRNALTVELQGSCEATVLHALTALAPPLTDDIHM
ncbi:hypothetical protein E2C01_004203 [Portunus trituberculatus]|uniref:Uncharacterized protein n=1 Tax=Portunus trituberculatus TaxID=210409 RepID=A0A5B7CTE2_PORTR|nr:hypothetical protein [Portunus trituberculatus]